MTVTLDAAAVAVARRQPQMDGIVDVGEEGVGGGGDDGVLGRIIDGVVLCVAYLHNQAKREERRKTKR